MTPSWKEAIAKKYSGILERLNIFERVGFEKIFHFYKWIEGFFEFVWWRTALVLKLLKRAYIKNIYPPYMMGDKCNKAKSQ